MERYALSLVDVFVRVRDIDPRPGVLRPVAAPAASAGDEAELVGHQDGPLPVSALAHGEGWSAPSGSAR